MIKLWRTYRKLWLLLGAGLLLRLILAPFGTLELDFNTFVAWSNNLAQNSLVNFYSGWSDYLPGYLFVLYFLGKVNVLLQLSGMGLTVLYKLPAILADILTGVLVYQGAVALTKKEKLAILAAAAYLFNPAVLANSTFWGQIDGLVALAVMAAFLFAQKKPVLAAVALGAGALLKLQAVFIAPIILFLWLLKFALKRAVGLFLLAAAIFLAGFIPFAGTRPFFSFVLERLAVVINQYPYTSANAFNFWAFFGGWWRSDGVGLFSPQLVGILILAIFVLATLGVLWRRQGKTTFLSAALVLAAAFLFLTRMHERHLLPAFAPLAVAAATNLFLFIPYTIFSLTYLANLYFSFIWINEDFRLVFSAGVVDLLILANLAAFGLMVFVFWRKEKISFSFKNILVGWFGRTAAPAKIPAIPLVEKHWQKILIGVLLFALAGRLFSLNYPSSFYFDEVYHAFTAQEILRGNPAAWEYWATPPEGFAYEWTHPPLAKLGMVAGMLVLGENPVGWRLPGALLGVGTVLLVYLIGRLLFGQQTLALLASALFALDGLPLVMSRIGMNDIYFLFLALLTIYLFLKDKPFFSALALGLALASKWTAFWLLPILLAGFFLLRKKIKLEYLSFLVVPPVVYLGSYLPFFLSGHTLSQFWELQQQMWWYHTQLSATHPFWSAWWSWPLNLKPVWIFTESVREKIANIYASGNPAIFFGGLAAVGTALVSFIKRKDKILLFLLIAYFGLFLPWAASPRIMFLYHYLPALPFLTLALAWLLTRLWQGRKKWLVAIYLLLVVVTFFSYSPLWLGIPLPSFWSDFLF